ncbi:thymine dioxygenase [Aspergillus sclerotioniger CBS 115572]|uniref:Thymine dioxygenase n=1 Tax=Aspergillus sclerotioniger CBS 115572 TaxID=1450535 RepID=A0A317X908_9EURO|nr:thymine dioxygenase [Aspergillus sclerotioniger CBS 115572]PWY95093.1 thymine dioxygenase [Aspergillus sclerotioniger CBS 115572]
MKIPVVDFSSWYNTQDESSRQRVAHELVEACQKVGFVYIVNHSLTETTLVATFDWMRRFFELSDEQKMQAPHPEGWAVHRGYSWPGLEKVTQVMSNGDYEESREKLREVPDVKEICDIGSENNTDQPNQWIPKETLPGFQAFMVRFYEECHKVGSEILRALATGLDLEDEYYLTKKHSGYNNQLRLLHYLPVPAEDLEKERTSRCPAHTDWSSITLLFQDDCGGLEVEDVSRPGTFAPANPLKNAIVMNVGDLLQRWSNNRLRSTNHRVRLPQLSDRFEGPNRMTRERYSIPYFMSPDPDMVIECIPSCMSEENPAKYKPITQAEYNQMRASMMY